MGKVKDGGSPPLQSEDGSGRFPAKNLVPQICPEVSEAISRYFRSLVDTHSCNRATCYKKGNVRPVVVVALERPEDNAIVVYVPCMKGTTVVLDL